MRVVRNHGGYTLIEILAGVTIVTMVTLSGFYGINAIGIGKVKLTEKTYLEQQAFYFSERFFELVKNSGTLDYEEYFNRQNVGNSSYSSGHYSIPSRFGNGATSMVYCLSDNGTPMTFGSGCIDDFNTTGGSIAGDALLFGQYAEQFIDRNSDADADGGDENIDGEIIGDDDDLYLGDGPSTFSSSGAVSEIYLINAAGNSRTFFRWFVANDPDSPASSTCDFSNPQIPTGSGCLGTVQFLKLKGVDWGYDHDVLNIDITQNDGVIDTWVLDGELYGLGSDTAVDFGALNSEQYWLPIFADGIHVAEMSMYAFPYKDSEYSWADTSTNFSSPYIKISMRLVPSWKNKRKIKGEIPEIYINTTINLTTEL